MSSLGARPSHVMIIILGMYSIRLIVFLVITLYGTLLTLTHAQS